MRAAFAATFLLALAAPAVAERWVKTGSTGEGEVLYVDLDSVTVDGARRTLQYKSGAGDDDSIVTLVLDCAAQNFTPQRIGSLDGPFPTAQIVPGSIPSIIQKLVCK